MPRVYCAERSLSAKTTIYIASAHSNSPGSNNIWHDMLPSHGRNDRGFDSSLQVGYSAISTAERITVRAAVALRNSGRIPLTFASRAGSQAPLCWIASAALLDRKRRFAGSQAPLCWIASAALLDRKRRFAGSQAPLCWIASAACSVVTHYSRSTSP
jgi:predicted nucleic acid-binding protein